MGLQKIPRRKKIDNSNEKINKGAINDTDEFTVEFSLWNVAGLFICMGCGILYAYIVCQVHEARMFFTGITEVTQKLIARFETDRETDRQRNRDDELIKALEMEREISFRTENGLYYSYYKQLVNAPSFIPEVLNLTQDRLTEHPSTINILARMNIYQEVLLAAIYRFVPLIYNILEPVYFYIYFVFALHGMLVCSLMLMAWIISGTWLSSCLTFLFYIVNSSDVTRVETYMPLRENFSLPCLWVQILIVTIYFRSDLPKKYEENVKKGLMIFTFLFALMWQFNQFALLLQAMALFGCQTLKFVDGKKIMYMYKCLLVSIMVVCLLQFFNVMILTGSLVSFVTSSIIVMKIQDRYLTCQNFALKIVIIVLSILLVFQIGSTITFILQLVFQQEADEHIYNFVLTKFGFESSLDFDVRLYLCNGGFVFLPKQFFESVSSNYMFPLYVVSHMVLLACLAVTVFKNLRKNNTSKTETESFSLSPELAYHSIQMVFFGALALMALRMKYFWTPYMCVFASVCLFKSEPWIWVANKVLRFYKDTQVKMLHTAIGVALIAYLASDCYVNLNKEMNNLREFYDPDTVELLTWINNSTSPTASFSGSMQLLAGVKLSTGRPITNHPHYEDKILRVKTKELYKYYGRYSAEEVHTMLKSYQTNYIIIEDSICLVPLRDGCGLPYILDMEAGLELDKRGIPTKSDVLPRFCDQVRYDREPYSTYFKLVLKNRTFRVYQVL